MESIQPLARWVSRICKVHLRPCLDVVLKYVLGAQITRGQLRHVHTKVYQRFSKHHLCSDVVTAVSIPLTFYKQSDCQQPPLKAGCTQPAAVDHVRGTFTKITAMSWLDDICSCLVRETSGCICVYITKICGQMHHRPPRLVVWVNGSQSVLVVVFNAVHLWSAVYSNVFLSPVAPLFTSRLPSPKTRRWPLLWRILPRRPPSGCGTQPP